MNATTVAVDLAKNLFQLAYADANWKLVGTARLTRSQFRRCFQNSSVSLVIMEACGSAHYWAREIRMLGIEVRLLPARYVRAYVKRNKTDAADAAALLEAARCADIQPVRIKSVEQQALQSLHRTRSLWMSTRTSRINALRGFCREFGIDITLGARLGLEQIARVLADSNSLLPELLRPTMRSMVEEFTCSSFASMIWRSSSASSHASRRPALRCCQYPASACSLPLRWSPPPAVRSLISKTHATSPPGSDSHRKSIPLVRPAASAASPSAAIGICACCSRTAHAPSSTPQMSRSECSARLIRCDAGHCRSSIAAITTRPSVPSPTSSHASATPCCVITNPTASHASTTNCSRRPSQCPPESIDHIATLAQRLIARHGSQDRVHTARCR